MNINIQVDFVGQTALYIAFTSVMVITQFPSEIRAQLYFIVKYLFEIILRPPK